MLRFWPAEERWIIDLEAGGFPLGSCWKGWILGEKIPVNPMEIKFCDGLTEGKEYV